ncbi:S-layer homology domain-containing protein [Thermoclostridium caenicola]|uniref:S-layer homology domain-containing protein n=1 Tax=Thermoclostridium caenicola TaxID=659425 RepID=A0A1M6AMY2_9FIRM|nr:S-layer homology domain-containing protein [Thermoclostridium caenicola]SHI37698.1 S-layer homology domain-containing protein [Thermoclostridium caenicola]
MKKVISLVIVLGMIFTMMPPIASAADELMFDLKTGTITIENGTESGLRITQDGGEEMDNISASTVINLTQTGAGTTANRIIVKAHVPDGVNIRLDGVNIQVGNAPFEITADAGRVNLILADGSSNKLISTSNNYAGLQKMNTGKEEDGLLTISCESASLTHECDENCGELIAECLGFFSAGIGGGQNFGGYDIEIYGGHIIANGGKFGGAGIGGGQGYTGTTTNYGGDAKNITISGGTVIAQAQSTGDHLGSDIGSGGLSGRTGASSNLVITGGNIYASRMGTTPVNGSGASVYKATFTIPGDTTGSTTLDAISVKTNGTPYGYSTNDTKSILVDGEGKLFIYLPSGNSEIEYSGKAYTAYIDPWGNAQFFEKPDPVTISLPAIQGVAPPVRGATPVNAITWTEEYTGTVSWSPNHSPFQAGQVYTATITLTPENGYTLEGVPEDFFYVDGATTVSNAANSGVITAVFPATSDRVLLEIVITTPPRNTYKYGETFSREGMVVKAIYDDGSKDPDFTAYTVDKTGSLTLSDTTVTLAAIGNDDIKTTLSITVQKADANNSGGSATVTFAGEGFNLTAIGGLFTLDPHAGEATYGLEVGGSGEGTINGGTLNITKAGTFIIGLVTAGTENCEAGPKVTATLTVNKGMQPAPIGLGKSDASTNGGSNGKITGLAANTDYEYRKDGGSYTVVSSNASGEITGLSAGSYVVRLPETDLYEASPDSQAVVIGQPGTQPGTPGSGGSGNGGSPATPSPTITLSEVNSELFGNRPDDIRVEADAAGAFGQSVEVKITDSEDAQKEILPLAGAGEEVYPFDISVHSRAGYSVKITLPVPERLLDVRERIRVVYKKDGRLETLMSQLIEKNGKWYITFEAVHFSPYALVVSPAPEKVWTNPFMDVREDDWFYSAVRFTAQNSLMVGTGKNTFSPHMATNRGMLVTILYKLSGSEENTNSTFMDVAPGAYYAKAVAWAQRNGLVAGYGNGMFGPEDSITREQLATILWKYAGLPEADITALAVFKDAGEISAYAVNALAWAYESGIITGKGNGILDPRGTSTRAETARILERFVEQASSVK